MGSLRSSSTRLHGTVAAVAMVALGTLFLPAILQAQTRSPDRPLIVVFDDSYPPYCFRARDGSLVGIVPDAWRLWSARTGRPVDLRGMDWAKAQEAMQNGEADVIDTMFMTPERERLYDFTEPWAKIKVSVWANEALGAVVSPEVLSSVFIGGKAGDANLGMLPAKGLQATRLYPSYESIIDDAVKGQLQAFVMDDPPAEYLLSRQKNATFTRVFALESGGEFHRAVRKGDKYTLDLVRSGFAKISAAEMISISKRWNGAPAQERRILRAVGLGFILAALVIIILIAMSVAFRRQVTRQNSLLRSSVKGLEKSEARTRALLEANPDIIFVFDSKGTFEDCQTSPEMSTYLPMEAFLGKRIVQVMPQRVSEAAMSCIARVLSTGKPESIEYELPMEGGKPRSYEARMRPHGDDQVIAIVRDITDRKTAELEAIRAQKLESLGLFAGGIAHDFNNLLTAIMGSISLARARGIDQKADELLDRAERAAERASSLTGQLLSFAKGGEPMRSPVDLESLTRETASFALSGSSSRLELSAGKGPFTANVDRGQISQVIHNIVLNAAQAMPSGGTVSIRLSRNEEAEPWIIVEVSDHGIGIAEEDLPRIFDPYFTTKERGTGLGLSICHSIVSRHGGRLRVSSTAGRGSTFTIELPAMDAEENENGRPAAKAEDRTLRPARVLVMDDEETIRLVVGSVLEDLGLDHVATADGQEALSLFMAEAEAGRPFGLVIADLTVPGGMGGKALVEALRKTGASFKALVVSGYSTDPVMADFRAYGFDARLAKPFKAADLEAAVRSILAN